MKPVLKKSVVGITNVAPMIHPCHNTCLPTAQGNITQVLPIITSLGSQAALAAFPGDLGDDVPFTLQAENTLASPLEEVPFFDNPGCEHALYFIDSLLLPKVVYPALGLQAELPSDGAEEGAGAPAAAPPALSISG